MPAPRLAEARAFETGRPERYTGVAAVARLLAARDDSLRVYEVRFEAGARTVWHVHAGEQWLIGLVDVCVIQCMGEAVRRLGPGEASLIPAGVRHWHGAGQESGASHLVLNVVGATTWDAPIGADEYAAALSQS
jgi:quercetin dioxygenase-like cupin family protein